MLDLTASGGIKDLSLGQRFIQVFGDVAPKTDSGTTDPYINFAGSGQLASTLGWNANDSAPFTISFWAKAPTIARINDTPMMMDCANYESGARFFETTDIPRIPNAPAIPPSMY